MQKIRILISFVFLTNILLINNLIAQNPYLELSGGLSISSLHFLPSNIKTGINAQAAIGISPYIPQRRLIPSDTIGNAKHSFTLLDENFRAYICIAYTPKGETKRNINNTEAKGEIHYFEIKPQGRYYIPLTPFYLAGGIYVGIASSKSLTHNGKPIKNIDANDYYHNIDVGTLVAGGCEIGVGTVRFTGQVAIEKGCINISKTNTRKHTFAILLNAGVSLTILNRHFRHY